MHRHDEQGSEEVRFCTFTGCMDWGLEPLGIIPRNVASHTMEAWQQIMEIPFEEHLHRSNFECAVQFFILSQ